MEDFKKELESLINKHSIENIADVPDFILAEMVCSFIKSIGPHVKKTLDWHGCDSICHPAQEHANGADCEKPCEFCGGVDYHVRWDPYNPNEFGHPKEY